MTRPTEPRVFHKSRFHLLGCLKVAPFSKTVNFLTAPCRTVWSVGWPIGKFRVFTIAKAQPKRKSELSAASTVSRPECETLRLWLDRPLASSVVRWLFNAIDHEGIHCGILLHQLQTNLLYQSARQRR